MATYTNITESEMTAFLAPQGFQLIKLDGTRELVFAKLIKHDGLVLSLRVYSGIEPSGESREVGSDAIRADLWWRKDKDSAPKRVGSSKRVHRVKGWKDNLQTRLNNWLEFAPIRCSHCDAPMVKRSGGHGDFFGCSQFPRCRNTASVKQVA